MTIFTSKVKRIIDSWDPIGLLATHAPLDEYDFESREISSQIAKRTEMSVDDLSKVIFCVFNTQFDSNLFTKTLDECQEIAKMILE